MRWKGYVEPTWEPATFLRSCDPFLEWKARTVEERTDLSKPYATTESARLGTDNTSQASKMGDEVGFVRDSRSRSECKERTVTSIALVLCNT